MMNDTKELPPPTLPIIHDYESPRDLSYGLTPDDLKLDPSTIDAGADLEVMEFLTALVSSGYVRHDPDAAFRTLNMALALYEKIVLDPENPFDGLSRIDLFAATLDTAFIWETG